MNGFYSQVQGQTQNTGQRIPGDPLDGPAHPNFLPHHLSSASSYADLQYLFGVQDLKMPPPKVGRNRRRSNQGSEHVKHRRTRSGCYTCRSRRVKCDENHPICERCKKGGRECVYPESSSGSKPATAGSSVKAGVSSSQESPGSSSDDYDDDDDNDRLESIPDEVEDQMGTSDPQSNTLPSNRHPATSQPSNQRKLSTRYSSETPSLVLDKGTSPSPSTEGSIGYATYSAAANIRSFGQYAKAPPGSDELRNDWSHLPQDLQFYMSFFCENLTYLHYSMKHDSGDFLRREFLDATLRNDALLHAVVGFAAFQQTLQNKNGKIQDFLQYYNKAVSLLLRSLKRGEKHSIGTLLTILQLATIEEYLGDWVNLIGHQKAAYEILTGLYTPQTVMQTPLTRTIFGWYARFDVFAGLMAGFETVLSREWFSNAKEYFERRAAEEPNNVKWRIEELVASNRLIGTDMSALFSKMGKGEISFEQFLIANEKLGQNIFDWKHKMHPSLQDPKWLVTDFSGGPPVDLDDIVDPYIPGTLYHGPLWALNICHIDWYSIDLMHKYQTAVALGSQPSKELGMGAYATCQLLEAIEYWPGSPKGAVLACQASLGIASLFLPRDKTHAMWCRRKLAVIESHGYIYPLIFRTRMSDLFGDESCMHWWLPNDENYPPIIRSIRRFVEERTTQPRDVPTEDIRDMKAIFSSMKLDDGNSSHPTSRTTSSVSSPQIQTGDKQMWTAGPSSGNSIANMANDGGEVQPYNVSFEDGQGYWGEGPAQAYGLSKQGRFN